MSDKKWYQKNWVIILLIIYFFPVGLYLMWKHTDWKKGIKILISSIFVFYLIMFFVGIASLSDIEPTTNVDNTIASSTTEITTEETITTENTSTELTTEEPTAEKITTTEFDDEYMSDGVVNGTNAKTIEGALKANSSYNWWEDGELIQSQINKEWFVYCANNEYNTYTKSYDLHAEENLEIEIAKFSTYDNDMDYILTCVSFFDTEYIDASKVKEWVLDYSPENGYVTKVFGDAEFVLNTIEHSDAVELEFSVYALD